MEQLDVIRNKIYEIRGQKVMLDFDLAEMYGIETRVLKQAVRRNIRRFPKDFMFELSEEEFVCLRSQFVTSNKRGGTRYRPFAFTEQGVAMLSSVLNSEVAIEINIGIMRNKLSELQQEVKELKEYMEEVFADQNDINEDTRTQLELINQSLARLQADKRLTEKPRRPIGYIRPPDNKE